MLKNKGPRLGSKDHASIAPLWEITSQLPVRGTPGVARPGRFVDTLARLQMAHALRLSNRS